MKEHRISAQEPRNSAQEPRLWIWRYKHYMGKPTIDSKLISTESLTNFEFSIGAAEENQLKVGWYQLKPLPIFKCPFDQLKSLQILKFLQDLQGKSAERRLISAEILTILQTSSKFKRGINWKQIDISWCFQNFNFLGLKRKTIESRLISIGSWSLMTSNMEGLELSRTGPSSP